MPGPDSSDGRAGTSEIFTSTGGGSNPTSARIFHVEFISTNTRLRIFENVTEFGHVSTKQKLKHLYSMGEKNQSWFWINGSCKHRLQLALSSPPPTQWKKISITVQNINFAIQSLKIILILFKLPYLSFLSAIPSFYCLFLILILRVILPLKLDESNSGKWSMFICFVFLRHFHIKMDIALTL